MTTNKADKYARLIRAIAAPIREALAKRDAHLAQLDVKLQDLEGRRREHGNQEHRQAILSMTFCRVDAVLVAVTRGAAS